MPQLISNILSIAKFVKDNYCLIEFNPFGCIVKDSHTRIPLLASHIHNNLYPLKIPHVFQNHVTFTTQRVSSNLWHQRLGHSCQSVMSRLPFPINVIKPCYSCLRGKRLCLPFSSSQHVSTMPLQLMHCDI